MLELHEERMSDAMMKYHLDGLPRSAVLHRFTAPDWGPHHDHPWPLTSFIVSGGYREEVLDRDTGLTSFIDHREGESFSFSSTHIHRIVELFAPEVWTLILPGDWEQKSGFWEVRGNVLWHRFWDGDWERVQG